MNGTDCIPSTAYRMVLRTVWFGDPSLLSRYHAIAPCAFTSAVAHSTRALEQQAAVDMDFYEIREGSQIMGFFGVETATNCLVTFGLRADYRGSQDKEVLWHWIRTFTDASRPLLCTLHAHNARARRFIEQGGGHLVQILQRGTDMGVLYHL